MAKFLQEQSAGPSMLVKRSAQARFKRMAGAFRQNPRWWFGVLLLLFVLAALFAPQVSPYDPLAYHPEITAQPPTWAHLLGTDTRFSTIRPIGANDL